MPSFNDLAGQKLGRLTVLRRVANKSPAHWVCLCDCGGASIVSSRSLTRTEKPTRSCGCIARETAASVASARVKHGHATGGKRSKLLRTWDGMMRRCYKPNAKAYEHYGGRGIAVCQRWHSFSAFAEDMGEPPSAKHSIDRIDNDKGYEPGNCRWASQAEQATNSRRNVMVTMGGQTKALSVWCSELGINYHTAHSRIVRMGWAPERALQR